MVRVTNQGTPARFHKRVKDSAAPSSSKHNPNNLKGLFNLGNTCYLNSCLQCLARSPYFYELLLTRTLKSATLRKPNNDAISTLQINIPFLNSPVTDCFLDVCALLRNYHPEHVGRATVDPSPLRESVLEKYPRFSGFGQQDSHEILRALLDCIKQEELLRWRKGILDNLNIDIKHVTPETHQLVRSWGKAASLATVVDRLFGGILVSSLQCTTCGSIRNTFEPFLDLSLPIADIKLGDRRSPAAPSRVNKKSKNEIKRERKKKRKSKRSRINRKWISSDGDTDIPVDEDRPTAKPVEDLFVDPNANSDLSDEDEVYQSPMEAPPDSDEVEQEGPILKHDEPEYFSPDPFQASGESNGSSKGAYADAEDSEDDDEEKEEPKEKSGDVNENEETILGNGTADKPVSNQSPCPEPNSGDDPPNTTEDSTDELTTEMQQLHLDMDHLEPFGTEELAQATKLSQVTLNTFPVSSAEGEITSIVSCLRRFTSPERLTGCNQIVCEACSNNRPQAMSEKEKKAAKDPVLRDFIRRDLILEAPALLTIHLKRFHQYENKFQKCQKAIDFPIQLDLSPFCSVLCLSSTSSLSYRLYAVVEHLGRLAEGHYVAYVAVTEDDLRKPQITEQSQVQSFVKQFIGAFNKPPKWPLTPHDLVNRLRRCDRTQLLEALAISDSASQDSPSSVHNAAQACNSSAPDNDTRLWFRCSDSHVTKVSVTTVLSCQPFLLFYERIGSA